MATYVPRFAPVQFDEGVRYAWRRKPRVTKHAHRNEFGKISGVLRRVVEHDFAQAEELLVLDILVELNGQARLFMKRPETPHALQPHCNVRVSHAAHCNGRRDVLSISTVVRQRGMLFLAECDFESAQLRAVEELRARIGLRRERGEPQRSETERRKRRGFI